MAKAMKKAATTCTSWVKVTGYVKVGLWGCTQIMLHPHKKLAMKKAVKKAAKKPAMKKAAKQLAMKATKKPTKKK